MVGFIPEITTTITVDMDTSALDESINLMENNPILSSCFTDIHDYVQEKKLELEKLVDPLGEAAAESLSAYQSAIIKIKHYRSGMMANSVDVSHDGNGVYLVGDTATSVDGFPYPLAIETGRREIYPINGQWLRWFDNGKPVFAKKSSSVPGDPFVDYSIRNLEGAIDDIVGTKIDTIWRD